ncbi:MAG: hypothetical protein E3J86_14800, partial [Candidatus Thorarchaeota archaeon]
MPGKDGPEKKVHEMKSVHTPGLVFVLFPAITGLLGALILTGYLPRLVIAYNYLRGALSPIDQSA